MQVVKQEDLVLAGTFPTSALWARAVANVEAAIAAVDWPHGSGSFSLNPTNGETRTGGVDKHPNGVVPVKIPMLLHLSACGWRAERLPPLPPGELLKTGDLDALLTVEKSYVAFEWETGNVASSHRAISKLLDSMCRGVIEGGFLVLPVRSTQRYMTDRIGNYEELEPYFRFWKRYPVDNGALRIYGIGHDALDPSVPHIPKGSDGRAMG